MNYTKGIRDILKGFGVVFFSDAVFLIFSISVKIQKVLKYGYLDVLKCKQVFKKYMGLSKRAHLTFILDEKT